jgi:hypothetical protein
MGERSSCAPHLGDSVQAALAEPNSPLKVNRSPACSGRHMVSEAGNELPGETGDDVIDEASLVPVPVNSLIGSDDGYVQHMFAIRGEGGVAEGRPVDRAGFVVGGSVGRDRAASR